MSFNHENPDSSMSSSNSSQTFNINYQQPSVSYLPPNMQQNGHSQQALPVAFPPSSNNTHFTFNFQGPMPYFPPNIQPLPMPQPAPASSLPISLESLSPNDLELLRHHLNNPQPAASTTTDSQASPVTTSQGATLNESLARLEAETYEDRAVRQEELDSRGKTREIYSRLQGQYKKWWQQDQFDRKNADPTWVELPAEPVTAAKVAAYMKWVMSRCKRNHLGQEIPNTTVGKDTIKQTISALESLRLNMQHLYKNDPDAQRPLREDSRVQNIERLAVANEATRLNQAQTLKAVGTTADTYTTEQLLQAVRWCHSDVRGDQARFRAIRDLVLFILPTATLLRGDNLRRLTFSDISMKDVPNMAKETLDPEGKVDDRRYDIEGLFFLSNQGKTNRIGRQDEHGAFRNRIPELCAVGAVAKYLFAWFHIAKKPVPDFAPDWDSPDATEHGDRKWGKLVFFPGNKDETTPLQYDRHSEIIDQIHEKNNINVSKLTHMGRVDGANVARTYGASEADTKSLGRWSDQGSYRCYDHAIPVKALLAAARWPAEHPENHALVRGEIEVPRWLLEKLWPWAEGALDDLRQRIREIGKKARDPALENFLKALIRMRLVLCQDLAVLYGKDSACFIFQYPPFDTLQFRGFATSALETIEAAAQSAKLKLEAVSPEVARVIQGFVYTNEMAFQGLKLEQQKWAHDVQLSMQNMANSFSSSNTIQSRKRRRVGNAGASSSTPVASATPTVETPLPTRPTAAPLPSPPKTPAPDSIQSSTTAEPSVVDATPTLIQAAEATPTVATPLRTPLYFTQNGANTTSLYRELFTEQQEDAMSAIEARFGREKVACHDWDWVPSRNQPDEWVPRYAFKETESLSRENMWREYSEGLDGCISVKDLEGRWAARWRASRKGAATEKCRRSKLWNLVQELQKQNGWDAAKALEFLQDKYPISTDETGVAHLCTVGKFIRWLQTAKTVEAILKESSSYSFDD